MTYNQKAWLGVLLLCTLFWVAVIGGACSLYNRADRLNAHQPQSEFAARHSLTPYSQQGAQASTAPRNG
ncbi:MULTISPECIES: hypothetical protein [Serratia]|uniref:hypothetical protein n=1 Tax=Serratia TaxID=613 RepID=UPI0011F14602|nr:MULTISPECIES: hypothetical protein [Serratia]NRN13429.1 hypothetical protein [Serratia marcescens]NRN36709.1 hypothetical protein [Serratia marcescens]